MTQNDYFKNSIEKKLDKFIEKSDKVLEESKETFHKQDKLFRQKIKQLLYKNLKYEFKKETIDEPTYLETLRPTIELKEYRYLKKIKPKFKKLGDFKILLIPKELRKKKNDDEIVFHDRRVIDTVKNAYSKDKTTSLKERRFIDKLSEPRMEYPNNKFVKGMLKTCDFIENENIIISNKIKKTSRNLKKKLDYITAKDAFLMTKQ